MVPIGVDEAGEAASGRMVVGGAGVELGGGEGVVVVRRRGDDGRVVGRVGLHHDAAGEVAAPGPARDLADQLEGALRPGVVGQAQREVGVDHPDQRDARQVEPLGDHLRADEHVGLAAGEALQQTAMVVAAAHRVAVPAQRAGGGEGALDLSLETLGAHAHGADAVAAAGGAAAGRRGAEAALVALQDGVGRAGVAQRAGELVQRERDVAAVAADGLAAGAADDDADAPPVEEQHRLLAAGERGVELRAQGAGEDRAVAGQQLLAQVDDLHVGQWDRGRDRLAAAGAADALGQVEQGVAARPGARVGDEVGRGGAEQRDGAGQLAVALDDLADVVAGGGVALLVGPLVLFIDDDQGRVGGGGEKGGAGTDDDVDLAGADAAAALLDLAAAQRRVQHRDPPRHPRAEAVHGLRRERDLGHEHQRHAALVADALGGGQVDLGLAAAGHPAQQEEPGGGRAAGGAARVVEGRGDGRIGAGLVGREHGRGGGRSGRGRSPGGPAADQPPLDQRVEVGGGGAGLRAGLALGAGPVDQGGEQRRAATLGRAAPQREDGRVGGGGVVAEAGGEMDDLAPGVPHDERPVGQPALDGVAAAGDAARLVEGGGAGLQPLHQVGLARAPRGGPVAQSGSCRVEGDGERQLGLGLGRAGSGDQLVLLAHQAAPHEPLQSRVDGAVVAQGGEGRGVDRPAGAHVGEEGGLEVAERVVAGGGRRRGVGGGEDAQRRRRHAAGQEQRHATPQRGQIRVGDPSGQGGLGGGEHRRRLDARLDRPGRGDVRLVAQGQHDPLHHLAPERHEDRVPDAQRAGAGEEAGRDGVGEGLAQRPAGVHGDLGVDGRRAGGRVGLDCAGRGRGRWRHAACASQAATAEGSSLASAGRQKPWMARLALRGRAGMRAALPVRPRR